MKNYKSLSQIQQDLADGSISCYSLTSQYLANIESNSHLNAFLETFDEEALARAKSIDEKLKTKLLVS